VTENADFGADVALDILVRSERADALAAALTDESAGRAVILRGENRFRAGPYIR